MLCELFWTWIQCKTFLKWHFVSALTNKNIPLFVHGPGASPTATAVQLFSSFIFSNCYIQSKNLSRNHFQHNKQKIDLYFFLILLYLVFSIKSENRYSEKTDTWLPHFLSIFRHISPFLTTYGTFVKPNMLYFQQSQLFMYNTYCLLSWSKQHKILREKSTVVSVAPQIQ